MKPATKAKAAAPEPMPDDAAILRWLAERQRESARFFQEYWAIWRSHNEPDPNQKDKEKGKQSLPVNNEWQKRFDLLMSVSSMDRMWIKAMLQCLRPELDSWDFSPGHDGTMWASRGAIVDGHLYLYIHDQEETDDAKDVLTILPLDQVANLDAAKGGIS